MPPVDFDAAIAANARRLGTEQAIDDLVKLNTRLIGQLAAANGRAADFQGMYERERAAHEALKQQIAPHDQHP